MIPYSPLQLHIALYYNFFFFLEDFAVWSQFSTGSDWTNNMDPFFYCTNKGTLIYAESNTFQYLSFEQLVAVLFLKVCGFLGSIPQPWYNVNPFSLSGPCVVLRWLHSLTSHPPIHGRDSPVISTIYLIYWVLPAYRTGRFQQDTASKRTINIIWDVQLEL